MMNKTVEQQAIEFVKMVAKIPFVNEMPFDLPQQAQAIVDLICDHTKVKPNQYCHLCGFHNVARTRSANDDYSEKCIDCGANKIQEFGILCSECKRLVVNE